MTGARVAEGAVRGARGARGTAGARRGCAARSLRGSAARSLRQSRSDRCAARSCHTQRCPRPHHGVSACTRSDPHRHAQLTPAPASHAPPHQNDTQKKTQRVVGLPAAPRRQTRQQRLHPVGGARRVVRGGAAAVQPQDAAQAAADHGVAAAVQCAEGGGRPDRGRDRGPDGDPAVARVLEHRGPASAVRPVRLVPRVLRVHRAGRVPRRARRAHRHRVAAHVAGGGRRRREGGAAHADRGLRRAADGRTGARLPHQLRVGARLLGVHVSGGAHDRHLAGEGPVRHRGHGRHLPAAVDLHIPQPPLLRALGSRARLHLHRAPAAHEENRHDRAGQRAGGRSEHSAEGGEQVPVDAGHVPQRRGGGGQRRARLLAGEHARPLARAPHGSHPVGRAAAAAAAAELRARRQHHRRLPRHGLGARFRHAGDPDDRAARGHLHLQGVLGRAHHRRDAGDDSTRGGGHRQLVHAGVPGWRLAGALRRRQRLRRQDHLQRPLHGRDGDPGSAVLHAVLRVHPEGGARGRHRVRHHIHGRVQRHQADVARQKAGPDPGGGDVRAVPDAAHRGGHPDRRYREHHLHPVPRGAAQVLRGDAQDGGGRRVPDDHAGPVPDVPVGGLRAAAGDQVRRQQLGAGGDRVHAHLQRGLYRRHQHRPADGGLPRAPPAALLLQREAVRVLHLRGGHQARALRRVLRGRGAGPAAGGRRPPAAAAAQGPAAARRPLTPSPLHVIKQITLRIYPRGAPRHTRPLTNLIVD